VQKEQRGKGQQIYKRWELDFKERRKLRLLCPTPSPSPNSPLPTRSADEIQSEVRSKKLSAI